MQPLEDLFLQYFEVLPDKSGFRCKSDGEIIIPDTRVCHEVSEGLNSPSPSELYISKEG